MEGIRKSKDNLCHIDRLGLARRTEDKCSVCGKTFYRTVEHVYKHYRKGREVFECSWTCYREMERKIEQEGGKRSKVVFADYSDDDGAKEQLSRIDFLQGEDCALQAYLRDDEEQKQERQCKKPDAGVEKQAKRR